MKYKRWAFLTDPHGKFQDDATVGAALEFVKWWKPEIKIHGGDGFDLSWLRGRASQQEQREKPHEDIEAGLKFIRDYAPNVFLTGNHDHRLWKAAESDDGKLAEFAAYLILDIKDALGTDCLLLPWDKRGGVYRVGNLSFVHGYHSGLYAVRQAASVYGSVVQGHIHAHDYFSTPGLMRIQGHAAGCLCKVDLDYNRAQPNTLRQANGWCYGLSFSNGDYVVWHAEKVGGSFILPSEMREIPCVKPR